MAHPTFGYKDNPDDWVKYWVHILVFLEAVDSGCGKGGTESDFLKPAVFESERLPKMFPIRGFVFSSFSAPLK